MNRLAAPIGAVLLLACSTPSQPVTHEGIPVEDIGKTAFATDKPSRPCAVGMVEVEGDYCPNVQETCTKWVSSAIGNLTCGEFHYPSRCLSKRLVHKHFCIDRYEFPNVKGQIPQSWMNWNEVKSSCEAQGKRLCTQSEWTFACEGPKMQPYPYGDGYHRDNDACNFNNPLPSLSVFAQDNPQKRLLDDLLVPSGAKPNCVSPFGVHDQVGNIDEFVVNEWGKPYKSGMMGGHVFGVRNNCRAMTTAHNELFSWYESGGRGCSDVNDVHVR